MNTLNRHARGLARGPRGSFRPTVPTAAVVVAAVVVGASIGARGADLGAPPGRVAVEANKALKPDPTARKDRGARAASPSPTAAPHPAGSAPAPAPAAASRAEDARAAPADPDDEASLTKVFDLVPDESRRTLLTVAVFAAASLVPAGLLMATAFVRINIVLLLLRQALGSPQIPGNQVLTALALLLTLLVMEPVGERVYREAVVPLSARRIGFEEALTVGSRPIKRFMADQIIRYNHQEYLLALYDEAEPPRSGRVEPEFGENFPLRVLAPAFLLSELTTALTWGFFLYLPFLVIDLVVSSVLASMGLFMLPPTTIAAPVKLILFVMADGWLLVSRSLLASFAAGGAP